MSGTITHSWNGTILTVTSDSGTSSADLKGDIGVRGAQGATGSQYKPKKGIDYFTEEEINEVLAQANQYTENYVANNPVSPETIESAVESYLAENPVTAGLTEEEVREIVESELGVIENGAY